MSIYLWVIGAYLLVLTGMNFWKSRQVRSKDDMMLAGRNLSLTKMVFTLICTWIGSGTFIAGAEFAAKFGWSAMWQPVGAWIGIIIIYFLASKIRTFGQYTVGDILEVRYGPIARVFGAIAIIISFTVIVSYQFKAGGFILNVITDGKVSVNQGMFMAALFVILFTAIGGMVAVANTDLPNGIIIMLSTIIATPLVMMTAGGWHTIQSILPASHFQVFSLAFGGNPYLKIPAYGLSGLLLLLGIQSMYQKFYSARTPAEAKRAAGLWVIGTMIVETVVVIMAVYASSYLWKEIQAGSVDPAAVILEAARRMVPLPVGVLLLGAATAVVISTGMNYLLSPTTTIMHDLIGRFGKKKDDDDNEKAGVLLQKGLIIVVGIAAFLLAWRMQSVLESAYFAYTIYGVAITPALLAALVSKKVTHTAGLISIILGTVVTVFLKLAGYIWPAIMVPLNNPNGDPFGIPIIYPALAISLGSLILVSFFTKAPDKEVIEKFFPENG
ncbi:MAG: sodium:solute symporter family protein [Acidobacteria bacterium]|nr:sodium:solute symporter family protein [Acidobacteriota bacterium]